MTAARLAGVNYVKAAAIELERERGLAGCKVTATASDWIIYFMIHSPRFRATVLIGVAGIAVVIFVASLTAMLPKHDGDCNAKPAGSWLRIGCEQAMAERAQAQVDRPKFAAPVGCQGRPWKNPCCPADYAWDKQNRKCRLGSSFRPDPVP